MDIIKKEEEKLREELAKKSEEDDISVKENDVPLIEIMKIIKKKYQKLKMKTFKIQKNLKLHLKDTKFKKLLNLIKLS